MEALSSVSLLEELEDSQEGKYLSFLIGKEEYAVEIRYVTEIIGMQKITVLPDLPTFVKGVINLRGKVIPAVDVRLRFALEERSYDDRTCIIITRINDNSVGLIVDSVSEVLDIPQTQIDPPPRIRKGSESRFIKGLGKLENEVKIILDTHKLLFEEELDRIESAIA